MGKTFIKADQIDTQGLSDALDLDAGMIRALALLFAQLPEDATLTDLRELVKALTVEQALIGNEHGQVYLNGTLQREGDDYKVVGAALCFAFALRPGDKITMVNGVRQRHGTAVSASAADTHAQIVWER